MTASERDRDSLPPLVRRLIAAGFVFYLALYLFNTVTRTGHFSPDSMNYVNVARNILDGQGITQPTLGFNQPDFPVDAKPPIPFTAQAPLYPLMIAFVSRSGVPPANSALLLAGLGTAAIFLLAYKLTTQLYDARVALAVSALLLFYYPMRWMAGWAWNDPIGVALTLLTFWLLAKARTHRNFIALVLPGLAAGMAFATRFALLPLFPIGALFLLLLDGPWKKRLVNVLIYTVGFALPFGAVVVRNIALTGFLTPPQNPVSVGIPQNVSDVCHTVFGGFARGLSYQHQWLILGLSILAICLLFQAQHRLRQALTDLFFSHGRWILILWSVGYLGFLVLQRSRSYFDVDARTIAPAGVALVILWSAAAIRATRLPSVAIASLAAALLLLATWREARAAINAPVLDFQRHINQSPRLTWLSSHTNDQDLIIGDDVIDVPFFLHRPYTLSFSPYPYTDFPTYDKVMANARVHCGAYRNIFLMLHRNTASEEDWRGAYGDFFADLIAGNAAKYPGVSPLETLDDGLAFQVQCR